MTPAGYYTPPHAEPTTTVGEEKASWETGEPVEEQYEWEETKSGVLIGSRSLIVDEEAMDMSLSQGEAEEKANQGGDYLLEELD
jgi:hypothetical protein